ncbi:hypothetical protein ACP70R_003838 [Stipagrostis hirtigluma subsp. patula]
MSPCLAGRTRARHLFDVMRQEDGSASSRRKHEGTPDAGCGDRISALPDEALQHVLGFLPADEAVRTSVLARRWRHLWKSMPVLRVIAHDWLDKQGVSKLNRFVNYLVLMRDRSALLDVCEFKMFGFEVDSSDPQVELFVKYALLCQARIIRVEFDPDNDGFLLGHLPLISQHLTKLELAYLAVADGFLDFSSCPSLKIVWIKRCYVFTKKISSCSVEELTIIDCTFRTYTRTRICAPNLVRLEITDFGGSTPVLESMPFLEKAFIRLRDSDDLCEEEEFGGSCSHGSCKNCGAAGDVDRDCMLLKGLSMAESLELVAEPGAFIFKRDLIWCPMFSNLKTLLLNEWCVAIDFRGLLCFLQHTPVLEKFTLQLRQAHKNWVEKGGSYNPSKQPFASNKLKVIEVKCEVFDKRVQKIFRILSTHGICIEKISVERTARCSECYSFQTNADLSWL